MIHEVILLMGSNLGDRATNLSSAISELSNNFEKILRSSSVYESEAWGFDSNNYFLNQIVVIQSDKKPNEVLDIVLGIETQLGRLRNKNSTTYESRIIDIDILFIDSLIMNTDKLVIPHPQLHNRRFTLVALDELDKDFIHPVYQESVSQLLLKCKDNLWVKKYISD